jgi:hypothetical protein
VYLNDYRRHAGDRKAFQAYLQHNVFDVPDHQAFMNQIPPERLAQIKADPQTGYAPGLDRR